MASSATEVTPIVLGSDADGNREMHIYENGESYDLAYSASVAYTAETAAFPYSA